jgi:hypothetical protein
MPSIHEIKAISASASDKTESVGTSEYFGWQVTQRLSEPLEFTHAPEPDFLGRRDATPNEIIRNTHLNNTKVHHSSVGPWSHLPKGVYTTENGMIVPYSGTSDTPGRRSREDTKVSQGEHIVFSSAKRQKENLRSIKNTRKREGKLRQRGDLRPQQGGRR